MDNKDIVILFAYSQNYADSFVVGIDRNNGKTYDMVLSFQQGGGISDRGVICAHREITYEEVRRLAKSMDDEFDASKYDKLNVDTWKTYIE